MPRIHNTRKQKAAELLKLAERGPSMDATFEPWLKEDQREKFEAVCENRYKVWAATWLVPLVKELVPELHEKAKAIQHDSVSALDRTLD